MVISVNDLADIEQMIADYRQSRARGLLSRIGEAVVSTEGFIMYINEPTSFNEVFAVARTYGLTLNSFSQGRKESDFFANWRRGDECFDIGRHERPFNALLIGLKNAVAAVDAKNDVSTPATSGKPTDDFVDTVSDQREHPKQDEMSIFD